MRLDPRDPLPYLLLATLAAAIAFVAMQAHAEQATAHIGATVCSIVPLINEDGTDSGFKCMDCGDGCFNAVEPSSGEPTTRAEQPVLTIVDDGEQK